MAVRYLQGNVWQAGSSGWAWVCLPGESTCDTICADGWDNNDANAYCRSKVRLGDAWVDKQTGQLQSLSDWRWQLPVTVCL